MKSNEKSETYRPFEALEGLLEKKQFAPLSVEDEKPDAADTVVPAEEDNEDLLFEKAMSGVEPIERDPVDTSRSPVSPARVSEQNEEAETLAKLKDLVRGGEGFIVSDTPEYMEGLGYGVHPEIATRLHRGDFSVQDHIDLHGLGAQEARVAFERFLKEAILTRKMAVLVVHGRGLSSPGEPVLKTKVKEWLTSGLWRKWVVAFTSARSCDGGAGATYVLLRQRPATKRHRRRRPNRGSL
jgi:DNA-nicking Smr family endonuclease